MKVLWRSLERWPTARKAETPPAERQTGQAFKAKYATVFEDFESELKAIRAADVVVEIDIDQRELRRNGEPYSEQKTRTTPGLVLHFSDRDGRAVLMACDKYRTWLGNLRALSLTLEALRAVDRYGATSTGEQYRGFTALPAFTTPTLSTDQAAEMLATWAGLVPIGPAMADVKANRTAARDAYRTAMKHSHPDSMATGGTNQKFTLVQESGRILAAHHGVDKL